nr:hypothetical protein [Prevotella sp.]
VALILTSIVMVAYQVIEINDVANGLLFYVGQAFLLAGSIFGLDYYVDKIRKESWGQEESRVKFRIFSVIWQRLSFFNMMFQKNFVSLRTKY